MGTHLPKRWCLCLCWIPPLRLYPFEFLSVHFPSVFALWPLSTPVLPSILPPPPRRQRVCQPWGVSECSYCQVVFEKHAAFCFIFSPCLRDMTKDMIIWPSSKSNLQHMSLVLMTSCPTSVLCGHLLVWNLHFSLWCDLHKKNTIVLPHLGIF